jgi:SAM-dependent methyltransferase
MGTPAGAGLHSSENSIRARSTETRRAGLHGLKLAQAGVPVLLGGQSRYPSTDGLKIPATMNRFENWFCASSFWRGVTRRQVLPFLLEGTALGEHVLELGAGAGAATEELRKRAARVTSLEYSQHLAAKLAARSRSINRNSEANGNFEAGDGIERAAGNGAVLQGDAALLPFRKETFSAVLAVLMLHHLPSREAQRQALRESFRVLRPGGVFLALEIENGWLNRITHIRSTFVPLVLEEIPSRLGAAGFRSPTTARRNGVFRVKALR